MKNKLFNEDFFNSNIVDWVYKKYSVIVILFFVLFFVLIGFLIFDFIQSGSLNIKRSNLEVSGDNSKVGNLEFPELKEEHYYTSAISGRKIFKGIEEKDKFEPLKDISYDFIKDLTLKGIMSGKIKRAVIEDSSSGESFLVGEGDTFLGVRVKDIREGIVVLYYKGKVFDLQL